MSQEIQKVTHSQSSVQVCQNSGISKYCQGEFVVEPDDFVFYDKIKVPPPTFCPECRFERRLSFMNIFSLYKDECFKCKTNIISMFHKDKGLKVYCSKCWWADDWDGLEYALDYDPSKNFFEQIKELKQKTPFMCLDTLFSSLVNSNYTNYSSYLKNTYALFFADYAEDSVYSEFLNTIKDTADSFRIRESELCYDSVGIMKCFGCISCLECDNSVNLLFSKSCSGCTDCFGCVNLRNKSYCIFNQQYSKEEYFEFIKNLNLSSYKNFKENKEKAKEFWLKNPVRENYGNILNIDVSGNYIYESKNAKNCYMCTSVEDSKYVQLISVPSTKDCYDYTCWGGGASLLYECLIVGHGAYNVKYSVGCYPNPLNNEYSYYASVCKDIFGCVNLKKKQYCILNKQYSKEEYEKLREQIIEDMNNNPYIDKKGRVYKYGEFFPIDLSSFSYNETYAFQLYPKTKEACLEEGYSWANYSPNEYSATVLSNDLPDVLADFENPTKEIIKCDCGKYYKIIEQELNLLKRLNVPIPRNCPECRRSERFNRILLNKSFNRNCAKCNKEINTAYAPDRPEIVYCEKCYQQEVY